MDEVILDLGFQSCYNNYKIYILRVNPRTQFNKQVIQLLHVISNQMYKSYVPVVAHE